MQEMEIESNKRKMDDCISHEDAERENNTSEKKRKMGEYDSQELADSGSNATEKKRQLIENIYLERARNDSNTVSLAQSIRSISCDALSGEKYLSELLQNADDENSSNLSWLMTSNGYLILMHEGEVFTEEDVNAICDNASRKRTKVSNTEQIGNKGIGFKAVFTVADTVYIFSDGYHFRFDERHTGWKNCVEAYPWQIIPIWTNPDELSPDIQAFLDFKKTCFVLKLRAEVCVEVETHLTKLADRHLLFLRHVKRMEITLPNQKPRIVSLETSRPIGQSIAKIPCGKGNWLMYEYRAALPSELKKKLSTAQNIPEKYKHVISMPFKIAIFADDNELHPVTTGQKVFCYLPTDLNLGMNVLVNAEFLLEPSRMHLREGVAADAWNKWILISLWEAFIKFLSQLAIHTHYAHYVFSVLTNPEKFDWGNLERFKTDCVNIFKSTLKKTPLVRDISDKKILLITNINLDWTKFIGLFGTQQERESCAHPAIQNQNLIKELGGYVFWIDDILKSIKTPGFIKKISEQNANKKFLICLKILEERMKQEDLTKKIRDVLKSTALILSARNELKTSSEVFFPEDTLRYAVASDEFIDLLHSTLYEDESLRIWLGRMGISPITLEKIVKMANDAPKNSVSFITHLVQSGIWKKFDAFHQKEFKKLRLKTNSEHREPGKNFQPASSCYLPNLYKPRFALETFTNHCEILLSKEYLSGNINNIVALKEFFLFVGVIQEINLENLERFVSIINQGALSEQYIAFTQWIFTNFFLNQSAEMQEQILYALHALEVISTTDQRLKAKLCYLADIYEPAMPLQEHAPSMHFISPNYLATDQADKDLWRDFFVRIGVHQKLVVKPHETLYRNNSIITVEGVHEYFLHLEKTIPDLVSTRTNLNRHCITFYLEIPCSFSLCLSPVFWELLVKHWESFVQYLRNDIVYDNWYSKTPVPSNIHVLVEKAIQVKYGSGKQVKEFYPVAVQKALQHYAGDYIFAEITDVLNLEQAELLGFKVRLPLADCAAILRKISDTNKVQENFSVIIFLYKQILSYIKEEYQDVSMFADINLSTHAYTFAPISGLYYLQDDFMHLTNPNPKIIKKPESFSHRDFTQLCQAFSIRTIKIEDIKVEVCKPVNSSLHSVLEAKWIYILNIILDKKDLTEPQLRLVEATKYLQKFKERFALLKIHAAEDFQCCYDQVIKESAALWIDKTEMAIYHFEPLTDVEHDDKKQLYQFLYAHFQLNDDIDEEVFLALMCATSTRLNKRYSQLSLHWVTLEMISSVENMQQQIPSTLDSIIDNIIYAESSDVKSKSPGSLNTGSEPVLPQIPDSQQTVVINALNSFSLFNQKQQTNHPYLPPMQTETALPTMSPPRRSAFLSEDHKLRTAIGKKGEEIVYSHLLEKHREKHGIGNIKEIQEGYIIQTEHYTKTVRWLNKNQESGERYDFEITTKKGKQQKIRKLEVKATRSCEKNIEINYSLGEWQQVKSANETNQYKLYVIRGINLETDNFEDIKIIKQHELILLKSKEYLRVSLEFK